MPYQLLVGDCRKMLTTLPDSSVHCCVTSPPYYGLRDYGVAGQIGLELTPVEYVDRLVEVFVEVRRVLHPTGTLWLNLGDSYANDGKWGGETGGKQSYLPDSDRRRVGREKRSTGLPPKNLIGIPWRVAFALQDSGWILRSDIIWSKPNPMPESVTDRPTKSHEYLFLLAKSESYFCDMEAIKEPSVTNDQRRPYGSQGAWAMDGRPEEQRSNGKLRAPRSKTFARDGAVSVHVLPGQSAAQHRPDRNDVIDGPTRNRRSVWTISTKPYPGAHFATYPPGLVEPCVLAGTSAYGVCPACGAPWVRETEKTFEPQPDVRDPAKLLKASNKGMDASNGWGETPRGTTAVATTGWRPTCTCNRGDAVPATVLDPFTGSGTTGAVACALGRHFVGIELKQAYVELAHKRIGAVQPAMIGF